MPIQEQTIYKPLANATVNASYTGTAGTTSAMPPGTQAVRVVSTTDCFVEVGNTAVAASSAYLPAYSPEYFPAISGDTVSAIQVSAAGSIYATPCN